MENQNLVMNKIVNLRKQNTSLKEECNELGNKIAPMSFSVKGRNSKHDCNSVHQWI